jgi:hypothetical protein
MACQASFPLHFFATQCRHNWKIVIQLQILVGMEKYSDKQSPQASDNDT